MSQEFVSEESLPLEFRNRLEAARQDVADARERGDKLQLAKALKHLGGIERRPPFMRDLALKTYAQAADLYLELEMPLDVAWILRHIGIIHEYAERLVKAEEYYDESLSLLRDNAAGNSLDFANTVRYPAVIKNRLGKRDESIALWEEACGRYYDIDLPVGVAEAAAHLTIFALDNDDVPLAFEWFAKADSAAAAAGDEDTNKFIAEVRARLNMHTDL